MGREAKSTLELSNGEVKNNIDLAFDIPPQIVRMLVEYRERIAPKIIGERPTRVFVNVDGTPKVKQALGVLITNYARRRAGITLRPHQFRHLSAKILLDDQPGGFETVKQFLGHKNLSQTVLAYAGIDSRRAGRHHQHLIEEALSAQNTSRSRDFLEMAGVTIRRRSTVLLQLFRVQSGRGQSSTPIHIQRRGAVRQAGTRLPLAARN